MGPTPIWLVSFPEEEMRTHRHVQGDKHVKTQGTDRPLQAKERGLRDTLPSLPASGTVRGPRVGV